VEVVDDFLDYEDLKLVQDGVLTQSWTYCPYIVEEGDGHYMFCCGFDPETSDSILPILEKIGKVNILRIKANLVPKGSSIIEHGFHIDYKEKIPSNAITSIFYVNTNNGYTKFEDGTIIESVANRFVSFPSELKHTGTTCTDKNIRIVINFNYY